MIGAVVEPQTPRELLSRPLQRSIREGSALLIASIEDESYRYV